MIDRKEFEKYLINHYGCRPGHGDDRTLARTVNGHEVRATFGNHSITEIRPGIAVGFLKDLEFDPNGQDFKDICDYFNIRR